MELRTLSCCNCGASLEIPTGLGFVTCKHCQSSLEVQESPDVSFTKLAKGIEKQTGKILDEVHLIRLQNRLERLKEEQEEKMILFQHNGGYQKVNPSVMLLMIMILSCLGVAASIAMMIVLESSYLWIIFIGLSVLVFYYSFRFRKKALAVEEQAEYERQEVLYEIVMLEEELELQNQK